MNEVETLGRCNRCSPLSGRRRHCARMKHLGAWSRSRGQDSGQAGRVANFLLAWHNAEESGGWDPVDLWSVDAAIADDMLLVLQLIRESHRYPGDLGFQTEVEAMWRMWRRRKDRLDEFFIDGWADLAVFFNCLPELNLKLSIGFGAETWRRSSAAPRRTPRVLAGKVRGDSEAHRHRHGSEEAGPAGVARASGSKQ